MSQVLVKNLPSGSIDFRLRSSTKEDNNQDNLCGRKKELGNLILKGYTSRGMVPQQKKIGF